MSTPQSLTKPLDTHRAAKQLPMLLQNREGTMTRELLLQPAEHGLGMTHDSLLPETTTTSVCGYCSTGCGLRIHLRDNVAIGLTPETSYPVNLGMACPKGWEALRVLDSPDRATHPLVRGSDGQWQRVSWDTALKKFVEGMTAVQQAHGPESTAFISTGQIACEEMALLGSLAKFGMGMIHGDGNTRQCMATSVTAYKESFGFVEAGYVDQAFIDANTVGYDELVAHVEPYSLESVALATGLSQESILNVAESIGTGKRVSFWWTMGVNQSYEGTRTAQAIINLALITGNIGRPGTGANSITGQCNAMGSRLWSSTTNLFGHRSFESESDRRHVAEVLGIDVSKIPTRESWSYDGIMEGIRRGEIRGLWVIATNPAHSWIDQDDARDLLDKLDFLVVQDMYSTTDTARQADLVLPAAAWGEKDGTFINSERRYGLLKKVRRSPGESMSDFAIFRAIAHYWGVGEMFAEWTDPEAAFRIMQRGSVGQPCDISGIQDYAQIDRCGGIQWPWSSDDAVASETPATHRRLFTDGRFYHSDGKARLIVAQPSKMPEPPDDEYPFILLTGRGTVSQWHTQTRTEKSPVLRKLYPNLAYVEIHPDDAATMGVINGDSVTIRSRRAEICVVASVTATVAQGQAFLPMHYELTNQLTLAHFDPYSRQPSYKDCAVAITAANGKTNIKSKTNGSSRHQRSDVRSTSHE